MLIAFRKKRKRNNGNQIWFDLWPVLVYYQPSLAKFIVSKLCLDLDSNHLFGVSNIMTLYHLRIDWFVLQSDLELCFFQIDDVQKA